MRIIIRKPVLFVFIFCVVLLGIFIGFSYEKNVSYKNADLLAKNEAKLLVEKVGKIAILPEGETPTVATVSDPALLKNQPFFVGAKKGDQVLIYSNSKRAILYDPVANKIVNMAVLNVGNVDSSNELLPSAPVDSIDARNPLGENQF